MIQLIKMAVRDIGRNPRRAFFSSLALAIGMGLLLLMASFVQGEMSGSINQTIRLQSGHLQIRSNNYEEGRTSLKWEDLVENPDQLIAQLYTLEQVAEATPRLYANGVAAERDLTAGVQIIGIDPAAAANDPYREGLLKGEFIKADDRTGVLIGKPLAEKLELDVGDQFDLLINTANGEVDEQPFMIRGIYTTQTTFFDTVTVFMPLAKAQTITQAENHASTIFIMLDHRDQAESVAAALQSDRYQVLDWKKMNELMVTMEEYAGAFMVIFYMIVLGITATVIINTLIMSVFERTREIGILSAIGMSSRRIMVMFLAESSILGIGGIIMGLILGGLGVAYFTKYGFFIGDMGLTGIMMSDNIYAELTLRDTIALTITTFVITNLAGLYPAILASRMEPIDALRGGGEA